MSVLAVWTNIIELRQQLKELQWEHWLHDVVFSFNWWLLFVTMIGLTGIWWIVLDKRRIVEIITFGIMVASVSFTLDVIGGSLVLWAYPNSLLPVTAPSILEIDEVYFPIIYMIIYQYFITWRSYFIAITITAFIFAFVLEPLLVWLNIYDIYHWKYIYSFPIYIFIGVFFKWLIIKMKTIEVQNNQK